MALSVDDQLPAATIAAHDPAPLIELDQLLDRDALPPAKASDDLLHRGHQAIHACPGGRGLGAVMVTFGGTGSRRDPAPPMTLTQHLLHLRWLEHAPGLPVLRFSSTHELMCSASA